MARITFPRDEAGHGGLSRYNDIAPETDPAGQHTTALRRILEGRQRFTATFRRDDGRTLHVRKAICCRSAPNAVYDALEIDHALG